MEGSQTLSIQHLDLEKVLYNDINMPWIFVSDFEVEPLKMSHGVSVGLDIQFILVALMDNILQIATLKIRIKAKIAGGLQTPTGLDYSFLVPGCEGACEVLLQLFVNVIILIDGFWFDLEWVVVQFMIVLLVVDERSVGVIGVFRCVEVNKTLLLLAPLMRHLLSIILLIGQQEEHEKY